MKRLILAAVLLIGAISLDSGLVVYAQSSADCFQGQTFVGKGAYFETIDVSSTALPFTAATYKPTNGNPASWMAIATVAVDSVRVRFDGTAPTATVGHLVTAGSAIVVCKDTLPLFQAIRVTTDAKLSVSYFVPPQ